MILVLAGTSDGRLIVQTLVNQGKKVMACAATPYGAALLEGCGAAEVSGRRLSMVEIGRLIDAKNIELLVDATHPYAQEISSQALTACQEKNIRYIRYQRPPTKIHKHPLVYYAADYESAAQKAVTLGRVIFLATGSKTLGSFVAEAQRKGCRVIARLLPEPKELEKCFQLGLTPADVVAMQGPFSQELNTALLRHYKAEVLVTKDGGTPGGMEEKLKAAQEAGIPVVIVERPSELSEAVSSIGELIKMID
jgi:precorrin-6A/cobalt-precorrin-6A reductase